MGEGIKDFNYFIEFKAPYQSEYEAIFHLENRKEYKKKYKNFKEVLKDLRIIL